MNFIDKGTGGEDDVNRSLFEGGLIRGHYVSSASHLTDSGAIAEKGCTASSDVRKRPFTACDCERERAVATACPREGKN